MSETKSVSGTSPSELMMAVTDLLDDGHWRPIDEVVLRTGKVIPPGQAVRRAERNRASVGPVVRQRSIEPERIIQSGRRTIVRELLFGSNFENATHDGVRVVRMATLPPRVRMERSRRLVAKVLEGDLGALVDDPKLILEQLTYSQLFAVALELAQRERERVLGTQLTGKTADHVGSEAQ